MSLISYAQNFEDIMLWRALGHVPQGFYVDVGAHDPINGSVSRLFYERGWRGLHVEPTPQYSQMLMADRPDEQVAAVAIGDTPGEIELTIFPDTGLTTAAPQATQKHIDVSRFSQHIVKVPQVTLEALLTPYRGREIHWLKIDIEGYEEQALQGWNSTLNRPWVMVLEATLPGSTEPYFEHWEPLLLQANYVFAYFDGLNRFYVAQEHADLLAAFRTPPNFFDNFLIYSQVRAGQQAVEAQLQPRLASLTQALREEITEKWQWVDRLEERLPPKEHLACALCGYQAPPTGFSQVRSDCAFGGGRLLRHICPSCDAIFGPQKMLHLSPQALSRDYKHHYQVHQEGDSTESELRAFYALQPKAGGTYLNYGAGAWSKSVVYLRNQGWNVIGFEPHSATVPLSGSQANTIQSWEQLKNYRFDGIYSNNVLEHLRQPIQELQAMRSLLNAGGLMSHTTPCYEYRYEYTRFHLFFYTGRSRQWLWQQAGLREISYTQDGDFMCAVTAPMSV